ncbi:MULTISPECIES: hypothetical protein [unclassified Fusibacter]|uniref:hypothetical protein n=1 Tax=unclassified Fusibacter TaxID=2624464 RepID=UPI001013364E|nr:MULTISPECIES: hypothetical protein [unclassified Fusibacter]MCK8061149.1 hypothetical protein [Fusibacter sp. A2]NPE23315.1 hypothetical protein [Fusibacter sp. A1]RXV59357.1 hypothetical protein DWB64_15960 [Fusibacter sp. A1]
MRRLFILFFAMIITLFLLTIGLKVSYNALLALPSQESKIYANDYCLDLIGIRNYYTPESNVEFSVNLSKVAPSTNLVIGNDSCISRITITSEDNKIVAKSQGLDTFITAGMNDKNEYSYTASVRDVLDQIYDLHPDLKASLYTGKYNADISFEFYELSDSNETGFIEKKSNLQSFSTSLNFKVISFWEFSGWLLD